ncbi:heterokaryon incompatibility, partial [Parathielavia hyrcaniae]
QQPAPSVLNGLSAAISDAIQVTKALGYNYLWVDRYCIDQSDPQEMHSQINQMDLIYSMSEVTLVAAAGTDETAG